MLLRAHVAEQIGAIARPRQVFIVAELPKTRSGKIMRRLLRDVAEGREIGDTTTLADTAVMQIISDQAGRQRPARIRRTARRRLGELDDELDLDRRVQRQHRDADGAARVLARLAEDLAEQLGGAVDDAGLAGEVGAEATKPTTLTMRVTRSSEPMTLRAAASALSTHVRASLGSVLGGRPPAPTLPVAGERAVDERQLPGREHQVAGDDGGHVGRDGLRDARQLRPSSARRSSMALTRRPPSSGRFR